MLRPPARPPARDHLLSTRSRRRRRSSTRGRAILGLFAALAMVTSIVATSSPVAAASGDFMIDFVAAAPESYDHLTGGGAYDDRTVGVDDDIVESLEGGDFACGDIVTYLAAVTVDDVQSADDDAPQTIELDFSFLADTTGQSGVAIGDVVDVEVNYGTVQDLIAGENSIDDGISDDGGSTASILSESLTGPLFQSGSELLLSVELTDLERNEQVVVRIDVKLFCDPGSNPTGNLQGQLDAARLTAINDTTSVDPPEAVPGGAQTIPFKQIGNIAVPDINVEKTVCAADDGGASCPGTENVVVETGDTVTYCYEVTDPGDAPLYNVDLVDDNRTPGSTGDDVTVTLTGLTDEDGDGTDDDLAAGGSATGFITSTITETTTGTYPNVATATGQDSIIQSTTLTDTDDASVQIDFVPAPAYTIVKTVTDVDGAGPGGSVDAAGDVITYQIVVENTGNIDLTGVSVSDPLLDPLPAPTESINTDGILEPGETWTYSAQYTATQADIDSNGTAEVSDTQPGTIDNTATVSSNELDDQSDSAAVPVEAAPALTLDKTVSPGTYDTVGDEIAYSYLVTNSGNVALAGPVTVADDKATVTCPAVTTVGNNDGNLDPTESITCTATYEITQADIDAGSVTNTAMASADGTDSNEDSETVNAVANPALSLVKDLTGNDDLDGSGDVSPGDTLTYTLTATNDGNVTLNNVTVDDDLTNGTTTCGTVAPGATCVLVTQYVVTAADLTAGSIDNTGTADSEETDPVTDTETVPVPQPALSIDKSFTGNDDEDGSGTVNVGDTLNYTVTATNDGTSNLTSVTVSDVLTGDSITCPLVEPSETCVLATTYVVTQADVDAGQVDNVGTADSDQTGPVSDPETVPVPQNPSIDADKVLFANADEDGSTDVSVGDTLTYRITATNDGDVTLTNVTVDDDLTGTADAPCAASLAPGEDCSVDVNYVVTQADVDAGQINNLGTVEGTPPVGDPITDTDPETVPIEATASIDALKVLDSNGDGDNSGTVSLGDVLVFQITATNDGNVTLTNVTVDDDLSGAMDQPCSPSLAPGESCSVLVGYTVTQADVDRGVIDNLGTVEGTPPVGDPVTDTDPETVPVPQNPALAVDKVLTGNDDPDGSGDVSIGDTLTYTITATNTGDITLTDVIVSDDLTATSTSCATLAPTGTCALVTTYTVAQSDVDAGSIVNTGTADSNETEPVDDPNTEPVPQPALAVDKVLTNNADEDGSGSVSLGDTLSYTITATNTGTANLTNVTVDDSLTGDTTSCALLTPGATCVLSVTYNVQQSDVDGGAVDNIGDADSDQTPPTEDPNTEPVPQNPSIDADKVLFANADEDGSTDVSVGDTLTYRITATNDGDVTLTNVTVDDDLTGTADAPCAASLAPGEDCSVDVNYVVTQNDVDAGQINNLGTVEGTPPVGDPITDTDPETVPVPQNPSILADKVLASNADEDQNGDVSLGDTLTYTITATNDGNVTLTNVTVSDALTGTVDAPCAASLAPDESCSVDVNHVVTQSDVDDGQIDNLGVVEGDDPNGDPVDDNDPETVPVPQNLALSVDKVLTGHTDQDNDSQVSLGDILTYTITASNDGNVTLTNVVVSDSLTGDSTSCASVAPGATCVLTVTYTVTQADVDAGIIENVGTGDSDQTPPDDDPEDVPVPQDPSIDVVKTLTDNLDEDGSGDVSLGDTLIYTIIATNDGNVTLAPVTVTDDLTGDNTTCASVAPGGTCELQVSWEVAQADVDAGQITNIADAVGQPPAGDPVTDTDPEVVPVPQNPSIDALKVLDSNGDGDNSGDVSLGDILLYRITATNDGNVTLTDVTVDDDLSGVTDQPCSPSLAPGASCSVLVGYTVTQADVDAGQIDNLATVNGTDPNDDPVTDDDPETVDVPQFPEISIVKTFTEDTVTAGGDPGSFTLVVTNGGNVTLSDVLIEDVVDSRLTVTGVSGTSGADADTDASAQTVEWLISMLGVGQSATVTVDFTVTASVPAATVDNTATVAAEAPQGDPSDPSDDITDDDTDSVEIVTDINLSIVKTFDPTNVPQGTNQSFTIEVANAGPSDAVDVSVTDTVDDTLLVTGATVTSGAGSCTVAGQDVDCAVQIPAGESITVMVDYTTAPFLSGDPTYDTTSGDEFRFVFVNGSVLEGTTDGGPVFLDGVDITSDVTIIPSLTKNDIIFDPPGPDPAFELHLSCSDPFTGGFGQSGGPTLGVDDNWQIAFFTIARYQNGDPRKSCGNVVVPFEVPNTGVATGTDSSGTESVSGDATVTVEPGITLDRLQTNGKRLTVRLTNFTGGEKVIDDISISWPGSNGNLTKIRLDNPTVWQGSESPTSTLLDSTDAGWSGGTLSTGESILRFDFAKKSAKSGYVIRVNFTDGTFLDIAVN